MNQPIEQRCAITFLSDLTDDKTGERNPIATELKPLDGDTGPDSKHPEHQSKQMHRRSLARFGEG